MLQVARLPVLAPSECAAVVRTVERFATQWLQRGEKTQPFHTLGAASYIDTGTPLAVMNYLRLAGVFNPLLDEHFSWLHERVCSALSQHLGTPVIMRSALARPGFHIWKYPYIPSVNGASLHFDLQYEQLMWSGADVTNPLSFTLALALPEAGTGLWHWGLEFERMCQFHSATRMSPTLQDMALLFEREYEAYTLGVMVVHSGHQLHQIAPTATITPGDQRITLQGHGLYSDGAWNLYW